jgi:formamidopyrimidine-DNA glycosylase
MRATLPTVPELAEVERYRLLAEALIGRTVAKVVAPDAWFLKGGLTPRGARAALLGRRLSGLRRTGKLLVLETDDGAGPNLGLRFGMSGRLIVDGRAALDDLVYASNRDVNAWDRFSLRFEDGGDLRVRDPRRLGGVELDPDEDMLGPDALSASVADLRRALGESRAPLKARLMDQRRLAGVGNLAADELLWRAGLDPARPAGSLSAEETRRLAHHIRRTLAELMARGGSHTGDLMSARAPGGVCPKDGAPLVRRTVGGRTTYSCPVHQT